MGLGAVSPVMIPPIADRFVAAETGAGALDRARRLNDRDVGAIVNLLGEHYRDRTRADSDVVAYRRLAADIDASPLRACLSVKPTQIGLAASEAAFRQNLDRIVSHARDHGVFVWIDMEDYATVGPTLDAFEALTAGDMGVCLQANLKRTEADLGRLADLPGKIRLVKGAYDPPSDEAYPDRGAVNAAYRRLLSQAFQSYDSGVAVATHDRALVDHAIALHETHGTPFEIQMLMGVREELQFSLARDYDVWQYIPYGPHWLSYFGRRVVERRENLRFALRAIFG